MRTLHAFLLITIVLFGCKKEEEKIPETVDPLTTSGVIGKWEIQSRVINNITSGAVICCEFIEFFVDNNEKDMRGGFNVYGDGYDKQGTFLLDEANKTLLFQFEDDDERLYSYSQSESGENTTLSFEYKQGGDNISEDWKKIE